jgi:hypothetical protein
MDLETFLISLYVIVDEWSKRNRSRPPRRAGRPPLLSDPEVLALAILSHWPRWRSERLAPTAPRAPTIYLRLKRRPRVRAPSVTLLMKLFGRFLGVKAIDKGTNAGHFLRRVHELADGQPEEIVSGLKNAGEQVVGPVNRCHAAEGDRQGNQRPYRRDRLTLHASERSQRRPQSYLGPIQGACDVRHLAGYYAQSYEEGTPAGSRQGRQDEAYDRYCGAEGDVTGPLQRRPVAAGLLAATIAVPKPATGRAVLEEPAPLFYRILQRALQWTS